MRATECEKEALSINCEPREKPRIEGVAGQGAGSYPRSSGDQGEVAEIRRLCSEKVRSYRGGSCLMAERPTWRKAIVAAGLGRRAERGGVFKEERYQGTPQGGPRSPLLANVLLDEVDKELERHGHCFVRYADDCNVYVRRSQGRRAGDGAAAALLRQAQTQGE
jgi:hypothetical protein